MMIRLVHGRNETGQHAMQAVGVPTDRASVADYMAKAWGEAAGWTELVVRTPKSGSLSGSLKAVPEAKWLDAMSAAWKRAKRR